MQTVATTHFQPDGQTGASSTNLVDLKTGHSKFVHQLTIP